MDVDYIIIISRPIRAIIGLLIVFLFFILFFVSPRVRRVYRSMYVVCTDRLSVFFNALVLFVSVCNRVVAYLIVNYESSLSRCARGGRSDRHILFFIMVF